VYWADAAAIGYHHRRWMLMRADVQVSSAALQRQYQRLTAETVTCPLAQSVERIHGKEKSGAILLVR
jgi:hypothetical protein